MRKSWFDLEAFHGALDAVRQARGLNWKQVAGETGVSASTLTRMAQGKRPDVDGLAALSSWSALDADDFIRSEDGTKRRPETLGMISSYLRSDRNLTPQAAAALEEVIKVTYGQLRSRSDQL